MLVDLTEDRCLLANAHGIIGLAKYLIGRGEETETHVHEALRLSHGDTFVYFWMTFAGVANLQLGRDEEAVSWFRRGIETNQNFPPAHFYLAAALAHLGQLDEAQAAVKAALHSIRPSPSLASVPARRATIRPIWSNASV